jgi:hypothetical protein
VVANTSPTARNLPSRLIERQVAALIRSLLVHVFEFGESPQSRLVCGVEGEYGTAESRKLATVRFLPSFATLEGVDGVPDTKFEELKGTAVGRARKNRCEGFDVSSTLTTTAAAPAVYAKIRDEDKLSKAVGEETVVPIILLRERPDSYAARDLNGDFGVRGNGEFEGVSFRPRPVFAEKLEVRGLVGVEDIIKP